MTNDLISQVEALLGRFAALKEHAKIKPNSVIFEMTDIREALIEMAPGLVEEIKHLRVLECAAKANMTRRDDDIGDLMKELAKWQQIAIDRTAQIGWHTSCNCGRLPNDLRWPYCDWTREIPQSVRDNWNKWAAKELGLQGYKTTYGTDGPIEINGERYVKESEQKAYIDRLEEAFLDAYHAKIYYGRIYYKKDPGPREERIAEAHAALEKIRMG